MRFRQYIAVLTLGLVTGSVFAQASPLVFAVNEGVTYRVNPLATVERFRDISEDLGQGASGH
jgi:phosphonate transport system substrate-binding protein